MTGPETPPAPSASVGERILRRIRFVSVVEGGQEVLLELPGPDPCRAVTVSTDAGFDLEILSVVGPPSDHLAWTDEPLNWVAEASPTGAGTPIAITLHGARILWGPTRAAVLSAPDRADLLLRTLIEFCYHERELRQIEAEVSACWPQLERDLPLAAQVLTHDPDRFEDISQRMEQVLQRRIRLARLSTHLWPTRVNLAPLAGQMMERLRERALFEARIEVLNAQLDVCEKIYEQNTQKISDFTLSRKERMLEWVIIILLAMETILLFLDLLWTQNV